VRAVLIALAACVALAVFVYVAGGRIVFLPLVLVLPFTLFSFGRRGR
jgi:hypothetical protein